MVSRSTLLGTSSWVLSSGSLHFCVEFAKRSLISSENNPVLRAERQPNARLTLMNRISYECQIVKRRVDRVGVPVERRRAERARAPSNERIPECCSASAFIENFSCSLRAPTLHFEGISNKSFSLRCTTQRENFLINNFLSLNS